MTPDLMNGLFELFASPFLALHVRRVWKDRDVAGCSVVACAFFTAWGWWNVYFYPAMGLWISFWGGIPVLAMNCAWLAGVIRYRRRRCARCSVLGTWSELSAGLCERCWRRPADAYDPRPWGGQFFDDAREQGTLPEIPQGQICEACGKRRATCFGAYEGLDPEFACDECCGHGNEDGWCDLISEYSEDSVRVIRETRDSLRRKSDARDESEKATGADEKPDERLARPPADGPGLATDQARVEPSVARGTKGFRARRRNPPHDEGRRPARGSRAVRRSHGRGAKGRSTPSPDPNKGRILACDEDDRHNGHGPSADVSAEGSLSKHPARDKTPAFLPN